VTPPDAGTPVPPKGAGSHLQRPAVELAGGQGALELQQPLVDRDAIGQRRRVAALRQRRAQPLHRQLQGAGAPLALRQLPETTRKMEFHHPKNPCDGDVDGLSVVTCCWSSSAQSCVARASACRSPRASRARCSSPSSTRCCSSRRALRLSAASSRLLVPSSSASPARTALTLSCKAPAGCHRAARGDAGSDAVPRRRCPPGRLGARPRRRAGCVPAPSPSPAAPVAPARPAAVSPLAAAAWPGRCSAPRRDALPQPRRRHPPRRGAHRGVYQSYWGLLGMHGASAHFTGIYRGCIESFTSFTGVYWGCAGLLPTLLGFTEAAQGALPVLLGFTGDAQGALPVLVGFAADPWVFYQCY